MTWVRLKSGSILRDSLESVGEYKSKYLFLKEAKDEVIVQYEWVCEVFD